MDITANEFFKNIINLYMGQPLQLYTSNKAAWNDLKQQRTDNVGKYINKVYKGSDIYKTVSIHVGPSYLY